MIFKGQDEDFNYDVSITDRTTTKMEQRSGRGIAMDANAAGPIYLANLGERVRPALDIFWVI